MHRQGGSTAKQCTATLSVQTAAADGKVLRFTTKIHTQKSITDKNANGVTQCANHTGLRRQLAPCVEWKLDPVVVTKHAIPIQLKRTGATYVRSANEEDHVLFRLKHLIADLHYHI